MNYTTVQEHRKLQLTAHGLGKDHPGELQYRQGICRKKKQKVLLRH